jgi:hypothetical protein
MYATCCPTCSLCQEQRLVFGVARFHLLLYQFTLKFILLVVVNSERRHQGLTDLGRAVAPPSRQAMR